MTRQPRGCVAAALCLLVLALTGEAVAAPLVANSLTLDSLRDATGAACVGSRLFVVARTGVVNVLDANSAGELRFVAQVSLPGDDTLVGATGVAAAPHPLGDSWWVWVTVSSSGSLVTLRVAEDGHAEVVSTVSSPRLSGAAQVVVRNNVALVAAVASSLVVSVDVSDPALPAVVSTVRLSGVDALDWPEAGLVRVVSGAARRLTVLSVTPRGGMAKWGSVKDVRLGAGGASRARTCSSPSHADFSVVLSDVSGTTLALVNVSDRGVPAVVQGLSAGGAAAPDTTPLLFADTSSAWPSGYTSIRGAAALACVNGTAFIAVPSDGDGSATGHLAAVQLTAFNAVADALQHEALRGTSMLVAAPWGVVAVAPAAGTVTSVAM